MLGHKSLKTTQHYAKILDAKLAEDMNKLQLLFEDKNNYSEFKKTRKKIHF